MLQVPETSVHKCLYVRVDCIAPLRSGINCKSGHPSFTDMSLKCWSLLIVDMPVYWMHVLGARKLQCQPERIFQIRCYGGKESACTGRGRTKVEGSTRVKHHYSSWLKDAPLLVLGKGTAVTARPLCWQSLGLGHVLIPRGEGGGEERRWGGGN